MNYSNENNVYIPRFDMPQPKSYTIEEVREKGVIVYVSEDGSRATVQMTDGLTVSFCGVTLSPEGKILDFIRKSVNKYARVRPIKENVGELTDDPNTVG